MVPFLCLVLGGIPCIPWYHDRYSYRLTNACINSKGVDFWTHEQYCAITLYSIELAIYVTHGLYRVKMSLMEKKNTKSPVCRYFAILVGWPYLLLTVKSVKSYRQEFWYGPLLWYNNLWSSSANEAILVLHDSLCNYFMGAQKLLLTSSLHTCRSYL